MRGVAARRQRAVAAIPAVAAAIVALLAVTGPATAAHADGLRSPDLPPGASWSVVIPTQGDEHYHCHQHPAMLGMLQVTPGAPQAVTVTVREFSFSPAIAAVAPGGTVTWVNAGNTTHSVTFQGLIDDHAAPVAHLNGFVVAFLVGGAILSAVLLVFAANSYARTRDASMAFVAGAFTVFMLKDALVAYSLQTSLIPHETLELVDAAGDLGTVLLLVIPIFWSRRR